MQLLHKALKEPQRFTEKLIDQSYFNLYDEEDHRQLHRKYSGNFVPLGELCATKEFKQT